jgi:hypothetical protein
VVAWYPILCLNSGSSSLKFSLYQFGEAETLLAPVAVETIGPAARGHSIIAHLGNGGSMAAVRNRQPVDTTMGFTPTGGVMMGTRSGDLNPGILLHLMQEKGYSVDKLEPLVNHQAGLLGVSGPSSDMKTLLDHNKITIEGHTELAYSDDVATRCIGYGENVTGGGDANDLDMLERALTTFKQMTDRPTLIIVNSHIAYGAPNKQDTSGVLMGTYHWRIDQKMRGHFYGVVDDESQEVKRGHYRSRRGYPARRWS